MNYTPIRVRQRFSDTELSDIRASVISALQATDLFREIQPGKKVAVLAGSRGIANIQLILHTLVREIKLAGGEPSIVSAMGSHGGGTGYGQREVLRDLGITPESMEAPVLCSDKSIKIGSTKEGYPLFIHSQIPGFDGILAVNRIKPHTSFKGEIESGLMKMLSVGIGGPAGASAVHSQGARGLQAMVPALAREVLRRLPVWGGLGILENAFDKTYSITGVNNDNLEETEKHLLALAKELMPSLPFSEIDLLIVEMIGKNFSGTGMDTNVINRLRIQGEPEPLGLRIKRIVALDLSDASHGNATGIGLADFTTRKLVDKINFPATYFNCLTSTFVQRAFLPLTLESEEEAIETALTSLGNVPEGCARILRIPNTLYLEKLQISPSLREEAAEHPRLELSIE